LPEQNVTDNIKVHLSNWQ